MTSERTTLAEKQPGTPAATRSALRVLGIPWPWYLLLVAVTLVAVYTGTLPANVFGVTAATMVLGCGLFAIGERARGLSAIGGGPLLCIFIPAIAAYAGIVPDAFLEAVSDWFTGYGFVEILVSAIIVGSILGMDRRFLITAGGRFVIVVLAAIVIVAAAVGGIAAATGFGFVEGISMIGFPVMAGGISGGAIPLSQMYADTLGGSAEQYMSQIVPPIVFANLLCILVASVYAALTRRGTRLFTGFNGNGEMVRVKLDRAQATTVASKPTPTLAAIGSGIVVTGGIYLLAAMIEALVPAVHLYAWLIVITVIVKLFGFLPAQMEESATLWYDFVTKLWIPPALLAIGLVLINIEQIVELVANPAALLLTVAAVVIAALAAGTVGWTLRMHFVESSITGGLCSADMGGSGDIATLGTADRMHLMPFAQIASRLGGGVVLLIASGFIAVVQA